MVDKITLSLHDSTLKERIKQYAQEQGLTVSAIVENYFLSLLKTSIPKKEYNIPHKLNTLLEGIDIDNEYKTMDYKTMRDESFQKRNK